MGAHLTLKGIAIRHLTHAQLFRVITDPWMESKVDNLTDDGRWVTEEEERASVLANKGSMEVVLPSFGT
jgi:hypothetical protein